MVCMVDVGRGAIQFASAINFLYFCCFMIFGQNHILSIYVYSKSIFIYIVIINSRTVFLLNIVIQVKI